MNKDYKISNYLLNCGLDKLRQLQINDTATFYLDKDGKIAAFDKSTLSSESINNLIPITATIKTTNIPIPINCFLFMFAHLYLNFVLT